MLWVLVEVVVFSMRDWRGVDVSTARLSASVYTKKTSISSDDVVHFTWEEINPRDGKPVRFVAMVSPCLLILIV